MPLGHQGDAMGFVIPLKKYFDMAKPGEYWALVSLTSGAAKGPSESVAAPIKVRVGQEPSVPKN
jgi:hypothetical protein